MELAVGALFWEPGVSFEFSHKVDLYIRGQIIENIMKPLGLMDVDTEVFLYLIVSTKFEQRTLEVTKPRKGKRIKNRNFNLLFPYEAIVKSAYPLQSYIDYFMKSLHIIFEEFGVTQVQIETVKRNVENEILNNPEYELIKTEQEINFELAQAALTEEIMKKYGGKPDLN